MKLTICKNVCIIIETVNPAQMREADATRKRKTKELISGLGNQEGDWRKMQKKRKHMK